MGEVNYKRYTIAIALVIVFLLLYVIVWAIKTFGTNSPTSIPYPPYTTPCPDYWENQGNGMCKPMTMLNSQGDSAQNGLATCNNSTYDTSSTESAYSLATAQFIMPTKATNLNGLTNANKCRWAKKCKVHWDGISDRDCSELTDD